MSTTATESVSEEPMPMIVQPPTKVAAEHRDVATTLNYYRDPGDGSLPMPVYVGSDTVTNERPTAPTPVTVHDITGEEDKYKLDNYGFQLVKHKSSFTAFEDEARIKTEYYQECAELYKEITGASEVYLFDHRVRRGPTHWHSLGVGNAANKGPLHRVHVDQSYDGAELIVQKHLPYSPSTLLSSNKRWQIINLWRPLRTIYKDPLAVAAAHSIPDEDLIEAKIIYTKQPPPLNRNMTWTILPNAKHEWYFKNEQKREEVLAIKCFDSRKTKGLARRVPHCAFKDSEREGEEWENRESIEVRALLIYDDE